MRRSVTKGDYGREKGNKFYTFLIISWTILFNVFFFLSVMEAESRPADEVPYFTNEDVKKYRQPADDGNAAVKHEKSGDKGETAKKGESRKGQEYWCKKATSYRRKIEKNREEVLNKEKVLTDLKESGGKKKKSAEERLDKSRRQLKESERDLADLEDEAHRRAIPPGWLRCQFDW
jgi:hypothetical protein